MIKKALMAVFAIFASTSAFGASPYQGSIAGGTINSGAGNELGLPVLVLGCNDPKYGKVDMCVDMSIQMVRPNANIRMSAKINPKLSATHKTILMRYNFTRSSMTAGMAYQQVHVFGTNNQDQITIQTYPMRQAVVTRISHDGGLSWSPLAIDYR